MQIHQGHCVSCGVVTETGHYCECCDRHIDEVWAADYKAIAEGKMTTADHEFKQALYKLQYPNRFGHLEIKEAKAIVARYSN
jgi:hypothetical protein